MNVIAASSALRLAATLAAALGLAAAAPPAAADTNGKADATVAGTTDGQKNDVKPRRERLYCASSTVTGTLLPKKFCKTRKEWEALGAHVPAS